MNCCFCKEEIKKEAAFAVDPNGEPLAACPKCFFLAELFIKGRSRKNGRGKEEAVLGRGNARNQ
jgi:hypothetical protein